MLSIVIANAEGAEHIFYNRDIGHILFFNLKWGSTCTDGILSCGAENPVAPKTET